MVQCWFGACDFTSIVAEYVVEPIPRSLSVLCASDGVPDTIHTWSATYSLMAAWISEFDSLIVAFMVVL